MLNIYSLRKKKRIQLSFFTFLFRQENCASFRYECCFAFVFSVSSDSDKRNLILGMGGGFDFDGTSFPKSSAVELAVEGAELANMLLADGNSVLGVTINVGSDGFEGQYDAGAGDSTFLVV